MAGDSVATVEIGTTIEGPNPSEFTTSFLTEQLANTDFTLDNLPVDPNKYSTIFHTPVMFDGKIYELLYKACLPGKWEPVITKMSLVDKAFFDAHDLRGSMLQRTPVSWGLESDDDKTLVDGEVAYRWSRLSLGGNTASVMGKIEVEQALRGKGLGTMLFQQTELLAVDMVRRSKGLHKAVKIKAIDLSENGWTSKVAQDLGYKPFGSARSDVERPIYEKIISL